LFSIQKQKYVFICREKPTGPSLDKIKRELITTTTADDDGK